MSHSAIPLKPNPNPNPVPPPQTPNAHANANRAAQAAGTNAQAANMAAQTGIFRNYTFDAKDPAQRHRFEIFGLDVALVNGLRRTLLTDIPLLGFVGEETTDGPAVTVDVLKYTGPCHNEILTHRFGMIPIHFDETEQETADPESYEFIINKTNGTALKIPVTTHDFQVMLQGKALTESEKRRLFPPNMVTGAPVLVTYLRPQETIHVKANVVRGTARTHGAGFSPVSLCVQTPLPDAALAAQCTNVLDRERAYLKNEHHEAVAFQFLLECECGVSVPWLVRNGLKSMRDRLDAVTQALYVVDSPIATLRIEPQQGADAAPGSLLALRPTGAAAANRLLFGNFTMENEDDTLGNLFQSQSFDRYIREGQTTMDGRLRCTYVGYYFPHPLEKRVVVRARLEHVVDPEAEVTREDYAAWFKEASDHVAAYVDDVTQAWDRFVAEAIAKPKGRR